MTRDNQADKPSGERILLCLGPGSHSSRLIEAARQMAAGLKAPWYALFVETPEMLLLPEKNRARVIESLRQAEQLGAQAVTLSGRNGGEEIARFASERKITKIFLGKPRAPRKGVSLKRTVGKLLRMAGAYDIYLIGGVYEEGKESPFPLGPPKVRLSDYGTGLLLLLLATILCFLMFPTFHLSTLIMIYLLGVMITAVSCGRGPAMLSSLLSVLAFDFFFVPPRFSFNVDDAEYIVTFVVMFLVALVISHLADRLRQQAALAHYQEGQARAMHGLSRILAGTRGLAKIQQAAVDYLSEIFDCPVMVLQVNAQGKLSVTAGDPSSIFYQDVMKEIQLAHQAYNSGQIIGGGTSDSAGGENIYLPLRGTDLTLGLLALRPADRKRFLRPDQRILLESLGKQLALSLEVEHWTESQKSL